MATQRIHLQDIVPVSEFRNNIPGYIKQVHDTKRPVIVTQYGKSVGVFIDVEEYELEQKKLDRLERMELLEAIKEAEEDIAAGRVIPHEEVVAYLRSRYKASPEKK